MTLFNKDDLENAMLAVLFAGIESEDDNKTEEGEETESLSSIFNNLINGKGKDIDGDECTEKTLKDRNEELQTEFEEQARTNPFASMFDSLIDGYEEGSKSKEDVEEYSADTTDPSFYQNLTDSAQAGIDLHEERKTIKEKVDHPDHYNNTAIETMEKILLIFAGQPERIKGALLYNIIKYTDRAGLKGTKKEDEEKTEFFYTMYKKLFPEDMREIETYRDWRDSK